MTDHARRLAMTMGLRAPMAADLMPMIEAAAQAAWATDRGQPLAQVICTFKQGRIADRGNERSSFVPQVSTW
jgi:hypothetical protein